MAWPKGKPRKFEAKADVMPPVKVEQKPPEPKVEPPKAAVTSDRLWNPGPDMGSIKPPAPQEKDCDSCKHKGETHYGGPKGWCNVGGCNCQEFK